MSHDINDVTDDVKGVIFQTMVSNSCCNCARAMNFFCFSSYLGQEGHSNYCQLRDFHETKVHVMVYMTFAISACIRPTAMNFFDSSSGF